MNMQSDQVNELFAALAKAQAVMEHASKDKSNPFFKSRYADLASVWDVCRKPLSDNGLSVSQTTRRDETGITLITTLGHSSGQWIRSEMPVLTLKNDPQALGSALTYSRRYSLSSMVGVAADDDDDGEKAQQAFRRKEAKEITESEEDLNNIINCFPMEDRPKALEYLHKWMASHSKSVAETVQRFSNIDELKEQFYKWLKK